MSQVGIMMSQCASEQFRQNNDDKNPVYIADCSTGRQSPQEVGNNEVAEQPTENEYLNTGDFSESEIPREIAAPARELIGDKIHLLKSQIVSTICCAFELVC